MTAGRRVPTWLRYALRLPVHLYAHGLGGLLGRRFLQLTHVGRTSGRRYHTVLEVVRYDPAAGEAVVVSGFGARADWLLNVQAARTVEVIIGRRSFTASHRTLPPDEAAEVLADYERRNRLAAPVVRLVLTRLVGWRYDGSPQARARLVRQLPFLAFRPAAE